MPESSAPSTPGPQEAPEESPASTPARPGKRWLLWVVVAVVTLASVCGGVAAAGLLLRGAPEAGQAAPGPPRVDPVKAAKDEQMAKRVVYDRMPEIYVNVSGTNMRRFLVVKLTIVFRDDAALSEFSKREMVARHSLIAMFKTRTLEDLDQPDITDVLGRASRDLVNGLLGTAGGAEEVYFTRFVVQ